MIWTLKTTVIIFGILAVIGKIYPVDAAAVTFDDYKAAVAENNWVVIEGVSQGDGKNLDARLYKPDGDGPFPALIALHGAGGIFPYQLWWAKEISKKGFVVLFIDSYCTRGHLCVHDTNDTDPRRGAIMQSWEKVDMKQRMMDAVGAYVYLRQQPYIDGGSIGIVGWSWGGSTALFLQKMAPRISKELILKGIIAFYPNLQYLTNTSEWKRSGPINRPTLIMYGKDDVLESVESYNMLLKKDHPEPLDIVAYEGATRKFDELGEKRTKRHPKRGEFQKAFHQPSFDDSVKVVHDFLMKNFK